MIYFIYIYIYIYNYIKKTEAKGAELVKNKILQPMLVVVFFKRTFQVLNSTNLFDTKYIFQLDDAIFQFFTLLLPQTNWL